MASPQKENGYTPIANAVMEKLAKAELSGREFRILLLIMRKTWGWSKKRDRISLGQVSAITGIGRQHVATLVGRLVERCFLKRDIPEKGKGMRWYAFEKDYEKWDCPQGYAPVYKGVPENGSTHSRKREYLEGGTYSRKRDPQKKALLQKSRSHLKSGEIRKEGAHHIGDLLP